MKPRRLKLASGIWRFLVANVMTTVWTPSGKRLSIPNWMIGGMVVECGDSGCPAVVGHYCGDPHCTARGLPVTPGKLRTYIEENLLN